MKGINVWMHQINAYYLVWLGEKIPTGSRPWRQGFTQINLKDSLEFNSYLKRNNKDNIVELTKSDENIYEENFKEKRKTYTRYQPIKKKI